MQKLQIIYKDYVSRDYSEYPLIKQYNTLEIPPYDDLYALYITLNERRKDIAKYFNVSEGCVKKWLKKYNIIKPIDKRMYHHYDTLNQLYGVTHNSKLKQTIDKRKENSLSKYGVESPTQTQLVKQKIKDTKKKKYGDNDPTLIGSREFYERMVKKYGCKSYAQTNEFKELYSNKIYVSNIINKRIETMRRNNSLGRKSKNENIIYNKLIELYGNVIMQYKSKDYPYHCDFYIPKTNTYIEYNGHWTHGFEPYIGTDEQIEKVKLWESKNTKYYNKAIYVWTELDVKKRNILKSNNLNGIIFYNMDEFNKWYDNEVANNL